MNFSRNQRKSVGDVKYQSQQMMTELKVSHSYINNFKDCPFFMHILLNNIERELRIPIFDEEENIKSYYFVKLLISSTVKNNGNIIVRVTHDNKNYDLPVQNAQEICDSFFDNKSVSLHLQKQRVMNLVVDSVVYGEIENAAYDNDESQKIILDRMNSYNNQEALLAAKLFSRYK